MKLAFPHLIKSVGCILILTSLSACTPSTDDLNQFTASVKASTPVSLEAVPEFHALPDYEYQAYALRSPFISPTTPVTQKVVAKRNNCLTPNFSRTTSVLENYGIDAIAMSGVMRVNNASIALFKTNDGKLHQARIGQHLGLFHGQITHIASDHVLISQLIPDGAGCYQRKETRLSIGLDSGEDRHA